MPHCGNQPCVQSLISLCISAFLSLSRFMCLCARVCLSLTDKYQPGPSSSSSPKSPSAARLNTVAASHPLPLLAPGEAPLAMPALLVLLRSLITPPNGGELSPTMGRGGEGLRVSTHGRTPPAEKNTCSFDLLGACSTGKQQKNGASTLEQTTTWCRCEYRHAVRAHWANRGTQVRHQRLKNPCFYTWYMFFLHTTVRPLF